MTFKLGYANEEINSEENMSIDALLSYGLENRKLRINYFVAFPNSSSGFAPPIKQGWCLIDHRLPCIQVLQLGSNGLSHNAIKPLYVSARDRNDEAVTEIKNIKLIAKF